MALDSGSDRVVTVIQTRPCSSLKTKFAFASRSPSASIRYGSTLPPGRRAQTPPSCPMLAIRNVPSGRSAKPFGMKSCPPAGMSHLSSA